MTEPRLPLVATGLSWRPAGRREPTVDHLDLRVEPGQRVLLAGASGSGKSTVLVTLAGLLDPESGDLGGTVSGPSRRGLVLQQPEHAVVAETIGRDVAFGPENIALPRPQIHRRVRSTLDAVAPDVDPASETLATSGGQLQRVALAGALALDPEVLLLDEPVSMLDAGSTADVLDAVARAARDRTVVIAEHRIGPWLPLVDRLVVLGARATVLADGSPRELLAHHAPLLRSAGIALPGEHDPVPPSIPLGMPALTLKDVALAHPDGTGRALHEHLSLTVPAGSLTAVTGPSGSGKSTLLRVALGLDGPFRGEVSRPDLPRISAVPQNPEHAFVAPTVREELLASPWARDTALAEALLEATGLAPLAAASPFTLSGGEQRRLAIAGALATEPALLVLDEPTVGLDAARRAAVIDLVDEARARGCAVLVATHDEELAGRADQRLALRPGPPAIPASVLRRPAPSGRLNQLTMLAIGLLAMLGSFAVDSVATGLLVLAPILLLAPATISSWRGALVRVAPTLLAMASVAWSVALLSGLGVSSRSAWALGAAEGLRIGALVLPGVLLLGGLDATRLGDALGQRLRLPPRLVVGATAGLARLGSIQRSWRILMETRRLRGLAPRGSVRPYLSATLGLLVGALREASVQALAMDARGFSTVRRRTWAEPSPFTGADAIGLGVGLVLLIWPWVARALV